MSNNNQLKLGTAYNSRQLHESEEGWYMFNAAWKTWRTMFLSIKGDSLLDLGCGSGIGLSITNVFRPELKTLGVELDMSHQSVWEARNIQVTQGNICNLHFPDESFDTVWSSHVLEHLEDPRAMIQESVRVAKKRTIHAVPVGNVDDKNLGTPHLKIYNRLNFKQLFSDVPHDVTISYVEDSYMSSFIAVVEK
jgi:ubiquinone/menaquinone biosynthesis C-methylase UbiE